MKVIPVEDYIAMRRRELDGERGVFFPEPAEKVSPAADMADALEAYPVLPPRVRRRV